jgi:hypothetical protein
MKKYPTYIYTDAAVLDTPESCLRSEQVSLLFIQLHAHDSMQENVEPGYQDGHKLRITSEASSVTCYFPVVLPCTYSITLSFHASL